MSELYNGLIDIGGILTETYYRKTKATNEALEELGYDSTNKPDAAIGIAQVEEFIYRRIVLPKGNSIIPISPTGTGNDMQLVSLYTSNPNADKFELLLLDEGNNIQYQQLLNRTQQVTLLPKLTVPSGYQIGVINKGDETFVMATLKYCSVLPTSRPVPAA